MKKYLENKIEIPACQPKYQTTRPVQNEGMP